jgi:DNA-directed RNA polymerase I subunit RPA1
MDGDESEEDEDDEDSVEGGAAGSDRYMVPLEVEAQLKLLWLHDGTLLDFVWSRAVGSPGAPPPATGPGDLYKLFFQRVVLVPPNRFRPQAKAGNSESLHPHTVHLTRILEANDKIKRISYETALGHKGVPSTQRLSLSSLAASSDPAANEEEASLGKPMLPPQQALSRLVSAWIELQNSVNCFVDSSKDPNPLSTGSGLSGLRQLLERKEGLFRMHMMGKRVNFCCRSVISPDPYIGTNEIGLPIYFARTLSYPTPVNNWNLAQLRQLVENGPNEYPG